VRPFFEGAGAEIDVIYKKTRRREDERTRNCGQ